MMTNTEKSLNSLQPEEVVNRYYKALSSGDLESIKCLMTQQSYYMTLESLGLKLAFKDLSFKHELENMEEDKVSLQKVERALSEELLSRNNSGKIVIGKIEPNGSSRATVHYTEDGKVKNLYFSKEEDGWKINYYAGRKVD